MALAKSLTMNLGKDDTAFVSQWVNSLHKSIADLQLAPELVIMYGDYDKQPIASDYKLCYKFNVSYINIIASENIYIDANNGIVFKRENL